MLVVVVGGGGGGIVAVVLILPILHNGCYTEPVKIYICKCNNFYTTEVSIIIIAGFLYFFDKR